MKSLVYFTLFVLFSAFSCSKESDNARLATTPAPVTAVEAPQTASLNETVTLEVTFTVNNGCGRFGQFKETVDGKTYTIAVQPVYVGEICTQALVNLKENYSFTPTQPGTYTFRFWSGPDDYIIKTIVVQ